MRRSTLLWGLQVRSTTCRWRNLKRLSIIVRSGCWRPLMTIVRRKFCCQNRVKTLLLGLLKTKKKRVNRKSMRKWVKKGRKNLLFGALIHSLRHAMRVNLRNAAKKQPKNDSSKTTKTCMTNSTHPSNATPNTPDQSRPKSPAEDSHSRARRNESQPNS